MSRQMPLDVAESLIYAVQKRDVLYNINCKGYKNRNSTEMAWTAVSREIGRDVTFCKTTWSQFRATYKRTLTQHQLRSASKPGKQPLWYLFRQMSFLKDHVRQQIQDEAHTSSSCSPDLELCVELQEQKQEYTDTDETVTGDIVTTYEQASSAPMMKGDRKRKALHVDPNQETFLESRKRVPPPPPALEFQTVPPPALQPELQIFWSLVPFIRQLTERSRRVFVSQTTSLLMDLLDQQD
ncbi:uncharacterized protein LOC101845756 [Aplysia californica]|uniref:Uncharacterized protein LOC101845756 n=1 Tax=Aplysia californica TaxID=6500 RepID=A0ABM0JFZ8_APLCA|nr:uncharacterized protein LOC101845756 [Aplysia californica]